MKLCEKCKKEFDLKEQKCPICGAALKEIDTDTNNEGDYIRLIKNIKISLPITYFLLYGGIIGILFMGFIIPNMIGFVKQLIVASLLAIYTTWIIDYQKQKNNYTKKLFAPRK